jgi:hypothetical protein
MNGHLEHKCYFYDWFFYRKTCFETLSENVQSRTNQLVKYEMATGHSYPVATPIAPHPPPDEERLAPVRQ